MFVAYLTGIAMRIETIAVHAGHGADRATGAVAPPLYLSTTFERAEDGSFPHGYVYTRSENPNRTALEACLQALEGGAAAAVFSAGSAATASIFQALGPGGHVIAPMDSYTGTKLLLRELFAAWTLDSTFVDMTDLDAVRSAVRPTTRLIWAETPSNPLLKITDIAAVAEIAHRAGAVPSPFDCWLILRGASTLPWRMRAHCDNAQQIAEFLCQHPAVEVVHYPGLASHPGHALAAQQMSMFGGMLSFQVKGDVQGHSQTAMRVAASVKLFTRATSLGGVESLIEHRASIEGQGTLTPDNLLRVSVGLEHPADLIDDLAQALPTI